MVRRHMTLTFVLMSVGWTLLLFTYFYLIMDGFRMAGWALPLAILGRNSVFEFTAFMLLREAAVRIALIVLPSAPPIALRLRPLFVELFVIALFWLICVWLYRRRIFLKV
jgi:predicted acyltransferase